VGFRFNSLYGVHLAPMNSHGAASSSPVKACAKEKACWTAGQDAAIL
jgi:hypothetical protein